MSDPLSRREHGVGLSRPSWAVHEHGAVCPGQCVVHALLHEAPVEEVPGLFGGKGDAVQLIQLVLIGSKKKWCQLLSGSGYDQEQWKRS